ncbi:proton-conducting transporter membrane subunit [Actinoplanes sp. CA-030573]|uniref:proton-conducting transporter transmembrane domain-containing protein n=1 Tax=Actinoplanes sp. CA-030573 TaxID=3239898 RepID=UPI003D8C43EE
MTATAGFAVAAAAAVPVWLHGPATGAGPLVADRVTVTLLLLVCGVGAVAQGFGGRYLAGDPRQTRFAASAGLLTAASAALVTAATVVVLAITWTVSGVALVLLLATYPHLPAARDSARRAARALLVGDAALWVAVGLVVSREGDVDLRQLGATVGDDPLLPVIACLVVVAALAHSAQVPFHRWLPASLAAPTPVSALLHAGVVNGGGVLLVRLDPLVGRSAAALWLAVTAGALTLVYGTAVMLTKPDIKGALVWSTTAQMGFMILTCGLRLPAVALFHLIGHGMYKATLFLGSGSAVDHHRRQVAAPPAPPVTARRAAVATYALLWPAAVLAATSAIHPVTGPLTVFAWATTAAAIWGLLRHAPSWRPGLVAAVGSAVVLPTYLMLAGAATAAWAPGGGHSGTTAAAGVIAVVVGALIAVYAARHTPAASTLYAWTVSTAHVTTRTERARRTRPACTAEMPTTVAWGVPS